LIAIEHAVAFGAPLNSGVIHLSQRRQKKVVRNYLLAMTIAAFAFGCESDSAAIPSATDANIAAESGSDNKQSAPTLATPLDALDFYIESLRQGEVEGVLKVMTSETFQLPGPLEINSFKVLRYETLTAATAAERRFIPQPQAGDVELDVMQYEYGQEQMYTYNLRQIDKKWRIYAHSAWNVDSYEAGRD
jgi:hypothetical protein